MESIKLHANIIDLIARVESMEAVLWGYFKIQEEPQISNEMKRQFHEFYLELVDEQMQELTASRALKIEDILKTRLQDMEFRHNRYEMRSLLLSPDWQKNRDAEG